MRSLSSGSNDLQAFPASPNLRYYGYTVRNMSHAPATVTIINGIGGGDPALTTITLAAKESRNDWPAPGGVPSPGGIFIMRAGGNTELAVFFNS